MLYDASSFKRWLICHKMIYKQDLITVWYLRCSKCLFKLFEVILKRSCANRRLIAVFLPETVENMWDSDSRSTPSHEIWQRIDVETLRMLCKLTDQYNTLRWPSFSINSYLLYITITYFIIYISPNNSEQQSNTSISRI